jgi:hypothetical protein
MRARALAGLSVLACVAAPGASAQEVALRVFDPTPRPIWIHFETSGHPALVGVSFGPAWPATYSVSGGVGRVEVSAEAHGLARAALEGLDFAPVPGTFAPMVIEIDLATLEATSEPTAGALEAPSPPLTFNFSTRALDTTATAGFLGPDTGPLYCTSQQQVDDQCLINPFFCGKTCTLVPGAPFDPATGRINLVGSEEQFGCDGPSVCFGPFEMLARTGDLRLGETPAGVPAASRSGRGALAVLLAASAALALRRWPRSA